MVRGWFESGNTDTLSVFPNSHKYSNSYSTSSQRNCKINKMYVYDIIKNARMLDCIIIFNKNLKLFIEYKINNNTGTGKKILKSTLDKW